MNLNKKIYAIDYVLDVATGIRDFLKEEFPNAGTIFQASSFMAVVDNVIYITWKW